MKRIVGSLLLLTATVTGLWAQTPAGAAQVAVPSPDSAVAPSAADTGSLSGRTLDAAGEAVAGASVRLTQAGAGAEFMARSNSAGEFSFPALAAGTYSAMVTAFGFTPAKAEGIKVTAQENTSLGVVKLDLDVEPVHLVVDAFRPGRPFAGIGGNFRLQHPRTDRQVVAYNLENLNVTWGRICMRWSDWHPEEDMDPLAAARGGNLRAPVRQTMEMARELARRNIPIIASIWFPPKWAISAGGPRVEKQRNDPLNREKIHKIYKSIGDYLVYLKEVYGAEPVLFSFNESEKGVNVYQSPQEHADLIKTFGAYLLSRGLSTKMLLADTSLASDHWFYQPALEDPETHKYIGAVGFHTWGGNTEKDLAKWVETAQELNVPVLVTEGGIDGAAHSRPGAFLEPRFQLREMDLYVRVCAFSQPLSLMHWQLTTDYSLVAGLGIHGVDGPLRPTPRFWGLKQLGLTEPGSFALPLTGTRSSLSSAAYGHIAKQVYTVHIVNSGGARPLIITGLPAGVKELTPYITDTVNRGMRPGNRIAVADGRAELTLDAASFTTLISTP